MSYLHRQGSEPFKFQNVGQVLKTTALKHPEREAIVSCKENVRLTFSEALRKVNEDNVDKFKAYGNFFFEADKLAAGFLNLGLERGDRVAIWSPNYEFWYISMLAIARAGLVCVNITSVSSTKFKHEKKLSGRTKSSLPDSRAGILPSKSRGQGHRCARSFPKAKSLSNADNFSS